jgi:hypothetical protein
MRPADNEFTFYDGPPFPTGTPTTAPARRGPQGRRAPLLDDARASGWSAASAGTPTACPSRWKWSSNWGSPGPPSPSSGSTGSTRPPGDGAGQHRGPGRRSPERIGRWVDFENDYKTMDTDFMESVWWVFKRLGTGPRLPRLQGAALLVGCHHPPVQLRGQPRLPRRRRSFDHREACRGRRRGGGGRRRGHLLIWTTTPGRCRPTWRWRWARTSSTCGSTTTVDDAWLAADLVSAYWAGRRAPASTAPRLRCWWAPPTEPPFDALRRRTRHRGAFTVIPSDDVTTDEGPGWCTWRPPTGKRTSWPSRRRARRAGGPRRCRGPVHRGGAGGGRA